MNITSKSQAVHVDKPEGSSVDYYIFPEYEIHYNQIAPGTTQQWHHHSQINETIFVLEGQIEAHWLDEKGEKQMQEVGVGDVIEVEKSPHTFINSSDKLVRFIVFRFVPTGEDKRNIIKNDKQIDPNL